MKLILQNKIYPRVLKSQFPTYSIRYFTTVLPLYKKNSSRKVGKVKDSQATSDISNTNPIDISELEEEMKKTEDNYKITLKICQQKLNEAKEGNTDPKIFNKLKLNNGKLFENVATANMKGNSIILITVFDPKDIDIVTSSILSSNLRLTPLKVPQNNQQLRINLPPMTAQIRSQKASELKKIYENYKNSSSKESLASIRAHILKQMKSIKPKTDEIQKLIDNSEKLHKDYNKKMQDMFKIVETKLLNGK